MRLHLYFARRFLMSFLGVVGAFATLLILIDLIEHLRRFESDTVGFRDALGLALLNTPELLYRILPLLTILATLALFIALARSSEMVIARAAGRSAIRSLLAPISVALIIGVVAVAAFNPIVAATSTAYENRITGLRSGLQSTLSISDEGLWLRQGDAAGQTVIHAERANLDGTVLFDVTFIKFSPSGTPEQRIEAERAALTAGRWALTNAKSWPLAAGVNPELNAEIVATLDISSTLTRDQIRDSFGTPSSIPIWDLPRFIQQLSDAGFSARRHAVWLQMELASPAFLMAMVLIGAAFTMRHTRMGRTGVMVLTAVMVGFGLYFIRNFAQILGENGQIPILMAAWAPPLAAIFLALGLILHLEDG